MQSLAAVLKLVADPARRVPPPVQAAKPRIQVWLLKKGSGVDPNYWIHPTAK